MYRRTLKSFILDCLIIIDYLILFFFITLIFNFILLLPIVLNNLYNEVNFEKIYLKLFK